MADYGHSLAFGTFLTPQNAHPDQVVGLAELTERSGLDLVTFQDHPYQPAFLDAWTLLTWVAARTQRVRVAANVHNLPLRPPAVLARAAASLDLLSGGRFELGLGAGGFHDAIAAMGGPRREGGQAVQAFAEALEIIRAIWDTDTRGGVRVEGEHYRVAGAKRGPKPAHDIHIWVGAIKPRMLRLIGAKADGWLPSLFYLKDGDLQRGNRVIDEAAAQAGRDPRAVRRLLNIQGTFTPGARGGGFLQGPPEQWVEQLLPFVLDDGVSTFILATDDPRAIETYGAEVAPALREAAARERRTAGTAPGEVVRAPKALTLRRDPIDYDAVPGTLARHAIEPGDAAYRRHRSTFWYAAEPGLILRPGNVDEVTEALAFARKHDVPLEIRSGGHGVTAGTRGAIVIDLARLNRIQLLGPAPRPGRRAQVRLEPGARWSRVANTLMPYGLAISSGDYGGVGVGGLATAGGIGFLARKHGLTIDHVTAAEVALADGSLVRADADHHPDLLWAVRGAGANVGIVTAFEMTAQPVRDVVHAAMVFDAEDPADLIERWGRIVEAAPRELTSFLYLSPSRSRSLSPYGRTLVAQLTAVYAGDDDQGAVDALTPLLDIGTLLDRNVHASRMPYAATLPYTEAPHHGASVRPHVGSGLAVHLTADITGQLADGLRTGALHFVSIRAVGGAVNDVDPRATAYAHRHQNFSIATIGTRERDFLDHWDRLRPSLDGLYLNFETDRRPERLHDAFPGETLARLRRVKARYDPQNVFDQTFPVRPETRGG